MLYDSLYSFLMLDPVTDRFDTVVVCCCSSDATKRQEQAAMQQAHRAPPLEVGPMCALGSGCVRPTTGRTRIRLPVQFKPAWTLQMLRLLTGMLDSKL